MLQGVAYFMTLLVDIGVFAHNEAEGISAMVRSLGAQDLLHVAGFDVRVLILANGCTDDTGPRARALAVPGIEVVELAQGGKSRTWNRFVHDLSRPAADILIFADADIAFPQPNTLRRLVEELRARAMLWVLNSRPVEDLVAFLESHPRAAIACGRRRERFPQASVYNRLCDREWDTPVGEARACGGDALMRRAALDEVGGYNPALIAGEEPEMCVRLRAKGWQIWRLEAEMTLHDAAMTRFAQWWKRARRGGHAYAEGAALHGSGPDLLGVAGQRRALIWGLALPLAALLGLAFTPWSLALLLLWPLQVIRLAARDGFSRAGWESAGFLTLGKLAEAAGVLEYWGRRLAGRPAGLIEYK